jgi:hypothetical protein
VGRSPARHPRVTELRILVGVDALLAWLYPNRVLVAAVGATAVVIVVLVGWRLGWHRLALRHPRASIAGGLVLLAVAMSLGWYLGSPLIIRTELVEAAPTLGLTSAPTPAAPSFSAVPASLGPTPSPTPAPTPRALTGQFTGADDFHFARGTATLFETQPGRFTLRLEEFSVRNGPDLYVYLSPDPKGYAAGVVELGRLKATDGAFNYAVPASARVSNARSVVIWCKAFSVQFGVAPLSD